MNKIAIIVAFLCSFFCCAQEDAWVYFRDKPDASIYLANPSLMLSEKSLERRFKQNISPDEKDVPLNQQYINAINASAGIEVMAKSKWLNALHVRGSVEDITALAALNFVMKVDFADRLLNAQADRGKKNRQKALQNTNTIGVDSPELSDRVMDVKAEFNYGLSRNQIEMLNGQVLHRQNYTGSGITIAVLDAGFPGVNTTAPFERLRQNGLVKGGYNFVSRSDDFYTGGTHGTLVLSTMAAFVDGEIAGTAPDASYYLFVTEDVSAENPVEESYWVEAAERADSIGVDVINTSLGYLKYDNPRYSYSYEDMNGQTAFISRGAAIASSRGIVCVVSAGNSAQTVNPNIGAPADSFDILTVGAVDANRNYSPFSSLGPSFDGRVKPDVAAKGSQATITTADGAIGTAGGTSFASPITAGLVACLWQALPEKNNTELMEIIRRSADRYDSPTPQYGYGIPDFSLAMREAMSEDSLTFLVYPNPTNDFVTIIFPKGITNASVTIFNNLGQKVYDREIISSESAINLSAFATGVYSYRISALGISNEGRIMIN